MSIVQTERELNEHLREQINFLQRLAKTYDEGNISDAKLIATRLRLLLHDTTQSKSLLTQLDKKTMKFYNTASEYNSGIASNMKLIHIVVRGHDDKNGGDYFDDAYFRAPLDNCPNTDVNRKIDFLQWWNQVVIVDLKNNRFSRKRLVLDVSNKDGGAHVDPELNDKYADLTRFNSLGWSLISDNVKKQFSNKPELATIRQICHEVLKSLNDEFPGIVSDDIIKCPTESWESVTTENGVQMLKGRKKYLDSINAPKK